MDQHGAALHSRRPCSTAKLPTAGCRAAAGAGLQGAGAEVGGPVPVTNQRLRREGGQCPTLERVVADVQDLSGQSLNRIDPCRSLDRQAEHLLRPPAVILDWDWRSIVYDSTCNWLICKPWFGLLLVCADCCNCRFYAFGGPRLCMEELPLACVTCGVTACHSGTVHVQACLAQPSSSRETPTWIHSVN